MVSRVIPVDPFDLVIRDQFSGRMAVLGIVPENPVKTAAGLEFLGL